MPTPRPISHLSHPWAHSCHIAHCLAMCICAHKRNQKHVCTSAFPYLDRPTTAFPLILRISFRQSAALLVRISAHKNNFALVRIKKPHTLVQRHYVLLHGTASRIWRTGCWALERCVAHASVQRRDQPMCSIAAERECQAVPLRQSISRKQSGLLTGAFLHAHRGQG